MRGLKEEISLNEGKLSLLSKQQGQVFCEVYSPVAPDVSAVVLVVSEGIVFLCELFPEINVVLVKEVGIANANPEEMWLGGKEVGKFLVEVVIDILVFAA